MKAKLVTFKIISRVIINDTDSEERAIKLAMKKIAKDPKGYLCFDNVADVEDDTEVPYDPNSEQDRKEIESYTM